MRIISGKYGGRKFPGPAPHGVRPTADAVRETIFNILSNHISFEGIGAADLCAGTGGLGFEALSRGAAQCFFVEKSGRTAAYIKKFASFLDVPDEARPIVVKDAVKFLNATHRSRQELKFDLVFADPPYAARLIAPIVQSLSRLNLLAGAGIFVAEHGTRESVPLPPGWDPLAKRVFGNTVVEIFRAGSIVGQ